MSWREILNPTLETRDKTDKSPGKYPFVTSVMAFGGESSKKVTEKGQPEDLEGIDREYFDGLCEIMIGQFKMSEAEAQRKVLNIVKESAAALRAKGIDEYGRIKGGPAPGTPP